MTAKTDLPPIPPVLANVAMIDGPTCAAAAGSCLSAWHDKVRLKEAPPPVIQQPRFTRWLLADVRAWLIERAKQPGGTASDEVTARAKKASVKAQEGRVAAAAARAAATRQVGA